jgi:hypothetical protein
MPISVELVELRARLEEVGMVVVQEPDYLTVRLPYFCSVRIHSDQRRLRFEPYVGMVPRTRATIFKLALLSAVTLTAARIAGPLALGIIGVAILVSLYDIVRVTITENVITRASLVYAQMPRAERAGHGDAPPIAGNATTDRLLTLGVLPDAVAHRGSTTRDGVDRR